MFRDMLMKAGGLVLKSGYLLCVCHCVSNYLVSIVVCSGDSMEPAVRPDDIWVVECLSRMRRTVQKGDIITLRSPFDPDQVLCKRVIAMGGEKVVKENSDTVFIPRGHIWIEGDNKSVSVDSREYGPVPYALIQSRMMFKIWSKYR